MQFGETRPAQRFGVAGSRLKICATNKRGPTLDRYRVSSGTFGRPGNLREKVSWTHHLTPALSPNSVGGEVESSAIFLKNCATGFPSPGNPPRRLKRQHRAASGRAATGSPINYQLATLSTSPRPLTRLSDFEICRPMGVVQTAPVQRFDSERILIGRLWLFNQHMVYSTVKH
jgi:hypothetical protein